MFLSQCTAGIGFDPLNIRPSDIAERLEAGGITGIKDGTLRPTIQRIKATLLNELLQNMGTTPFSPPSEFCERLSVKLNREVRPEEISNALLLDMQAKFGNK